MSNVKPEAQGGGLPSAQVFAAAAAAAAAVAAATAAAAAGASSGAPADLSPEMKQVMQAKCKQIVELVAPLAQMGEIEDYAAKVLEVDEMIRTSASGVDVDEFTFVRPEATTPTFSCPLCGNRDQKFFIQDSKQGDTICMGRGGVGCGGVVQEHRVHEGSAYRTFEGEEDRSHHGPAPNRLYSAAYNMRTHISGGGADSGRLRRLADEAEMKLSQVGRDGERRTRVGYKDMQKKEVFDEINHAAANCDLHEVVAERAKELFAGWRNVKEAVHHKESVIAGCLVAAYRELTLREARDRRVKAVEVIACPLCGNRDLACFTKIAAAAPPATGVKTEEAEEVKEIYLCLGAPGAPPCGGRAVPRIELVHEAPSDDPLNPFKCERCQRRFNNRRALSMHQRDCGHAVAAGDMVVFRASPGEAYLVVEVTEDGHARLRNAAGVEHGRLEPLATLMRSSAAGNPTHNGTAARSNGPAAPGAPLSEWELPEVRRWLTHLAFSSNLHTAASDAVVAELEKIASTGEEGGSNGLVNGHGKRKLHRSAGQVIQLWSLAKFEAVTGDAAAARVLHGDMARMQTEKQLGVKRAAADRHALQRRNQLVRKPWIQVPGGPT